jgi:hypothetical protein
MAAVNVVPKAVVSIIFGLIIFIFNKIACLVKQLEIGSQKILTQDFLFTLNSLKSLFNSSLKISIKSLV